MLPLGGKSNVLKISPEHSPGRSLVLKYTYVLVARPVMVQCNPWENPVYFDGCCTHTEKIKFLLWHRVFVYTMEEVRMILYDYQFISKTFVYAILKTSPVKTWAYSLDT